MILTNTLNPSIDISYLVESLEIGAVHRPTQMIKNAGGKGINVTKVLDDFDQYIKSIYRYQLSS